MKQEDYLMRVLEAFGRTIGKLAADVFELTKTGNYAEAHAMIDQMARQLIGLPTEGLVRLRHENLLDHLVRQQGESWAETAQHLAVLLREDALVYAMEGEETAVVTRRLTALHLWLTLAVHQERFSHDEQIDDLAEMLADYQLPGQTYAALLVYYEQRGEYGRAEDVLYDWLDSEVALHDLNSVNPVEMGVNFYRRLLARSDAELAQGNLPRPEVEAGLAELLAE